MCVASSDVNMCIYCEPCELPMGNMHTHPHSWRDQRMAAAAAAADWARLEETRPLSSLQEEESSGLQSPLDLGTTQHILELIKKICNYISSWVIQSSTGKCITAQPKAESKPPQKTRTGRTPGISPELISTYVFLPDYWGCLLSWQ